MARLLRGRGGVVIRRLFTWLLVLLGVIGRYEAEATS
jgi:hypothetical protein